MNVLSLFDGISTARYCLGDKVKTYYASEIDKYAIKIAQKNYPDTIQLGDVKSIDTASLPKIDLLIGGSPCQDLSIAKKDRKGLDGERSGLFYEYLRIKRELNPTWFILENVASMPKEAKETITKEMGVEPIMIDAALVSAQSRKRLFWTNIPVKELPADKGIILKDILQPDGEVDKSMITSSGKSFCLDANYYKGSSAEHSKEKKNRTLVIGRDIGRRLDENGKRCDDDKTIPTQRRIELRTDEKCGTLTHVLKDNLVVSDSIIRKLTPIECERLQSLPDNYTEGISNTQRYKCLGNGFNAEVIKHILSFIPKL